MNITPQQFELAELYRRAMVRFQHPEWFGIGVKVEGTEKHLPVAANGKNNPFPIIKTTKDGVTYRAASTKTKNHRLCHLLGIRPVFHLTRGDRPEALLALDIDGSAGGDWRVAAEYGRAILTICKMQTGIDIQTFAEPGRSWPRTGGAYLWFRINYGDLAGPARNSIEKRFNRTLKKIASTITPPAGVKFDAIKGLSTFVYDNPRFDEQLASSESSRSHQLVEVTPDCFVTKRDARKLFMAQGMIRSEADDKIARLHTKWEAMTELQAYESHRFFYGLENGQVNRGAKAIYRRELQKTVRHYGVLVTDPCHAALSGQRENNIAAFVEWVNRKDVAVSADKLAQVLPAENVRTPRAKAAVKNDILAESGHGAGIVLPLPKSVFGGDDLAIANDENADPLERMRAWNRLHMRFTGGDVERSVAMTVAAYEGVDGPATGHSQEEHAERMDRARRHCDVLAACFEPTMTRGKGQDDRTFWLTPEKVVGMVADLKSLIPATWQHEEKKLHPSARPSYQATAAVYGCYIRLASSAAKGWGEHTISDVPVAGIEGLLAELGMTLSRGTIASCTRLLRRARLIVKMRNHFHSSMPTTGGNQATGRAASFAINVTLHCPTWAFSHIPDCSRLADVAESSIAAPLFPSSTSFDNEEYGNIPLIVECWGWSEGGEGEVCGGDVMGGMGEVMNFAGNVGFVAV